MSPYTYHDCVEEEASRTTTLLLEYHRVNDSRNTAHNISVLYVTKVKYIPRHTYICTINS